MKRERASHLYKSITGGICYLIFNFLINSNVAAHEPAPVLTHHQISIGKQKLKYSAEVGRLPIRDDATGEAHAYMFYTAYRLKTDSETPRPLLFLWGGGPGGWSLNMNFEFAGPVRSKTIYGPGGGELVPNEDTLLSVADLVFVDQIGTGYSRATKTEYIEEFQSTINDTRSFAEFIRLWRVRHRLEETRIFIGGISWGAPRAATVSYSLLEKGLPLAGAVLITGETSLNSRSKYISDIEFEALRVIGMSEVAFFHSKTDTKADHGLREIKRAAREWVYKIYIPALENISSLTLSEKQNIAAQLAGFTGISQEKINLQTLVILPSEFRKYLLDDGKVLYGSDTRRTERYKTTYVNAALNSIKSDLGYISDLNYRQIGERLIGYYTGEQPKSPMQFPWDYATSPVPKEEADRLIANAIARGAGPPTIGTPLSGTEEAIGLNPDLKVLVVIARFDGESTCESNLALQDKLPGTLSKAMTIKCYNAGHSPWRTPSVRKEVSDDVKKMLLEATGVIKK
ncbi:S10 family serine carboxypeptidase-like protein [Kordiimonas pumila]|uniref:AB hydrolase-1 domain-containing protein n=1 Tax=Kordiimonas pumila TaxID=2161677 RepID=A0ABV7D3T5_9PROT|nr:hypothetical protein [Kordiimonas pumila]